MHLPCSIGAAWRRGSTAAALPKRNDAVEVELRRPVGLVRWRTASSVIGHHAPPFAVIRRGENALFSAKPGNISDVARRGSGGIPAVPKLCEKFKPVPIAGRSLAPDRVNAELRTCRAAIENRPRFGVPRLRGPLIRRSQQVRSFHTVWGAAGSMCSCAGPRNASHVRSRTQSFAASAQPATVGLTDRTDSSLKGCWLQVRLFACGSLPTVDEKYPLLVLWCSPSFRWR
jgi:hypothetical protein